MKKINYLILLVVVLVGVSCEPTYTKTYSWAYPVAGDWMVNTYDSNGAKTGGPYEIKAYNSAFGKDSIWIDDYGIGVASTSQYGNWWTMKFKVGVDMSSKTFTNGTKIVTNNIPGYNIGIKVANGKIIGNDSIYFEVSFQDDTTPYSTTYKAAGHREVSYEEYMQQ